MNDQLLRILYILGMIFILIHTKICNVISRAQKDRPSSSTVCRSTELPNGKLYVDCTNEKLVSFPIFQEANKIQILNMSDNISILLGKKLLENFIELEELIMNHAVLLAPNEPDFLKPLVKLQVLDFSYLTTSFSLRSLEFPSNIKRLYVNYMHPQVIDVRSQPLNLENLGDLLELSVQRGFLDWFPKLNETCPITSIDLSRNSLINFKYQELAPFCTLETLTLDDTEIPSNGDLCCGLTLWTREFHISTTLTCNSSYACDGKLDEDAKEAYHQCEERINIQETNWPNFLLQIIMMVSLCAAFLFLIYRYYSSHAVAAVRREHIEEELSEEED